MFVDRLNRQELPSYGMNVIVPRITGPSASRREASEGDLLATQDPVETDFTAPVRTIGGYLPSQSAVAGEHRTPVKSSWRIS